MVRNRDYRLDLIQLNLQVIIIQLMAFSANDLQRVNAFITDAITHPNVLPNLAGI